MNSKILTVGLLGATAAAVALYPTLRSAAAGNGPVPHAAARPQVEAVFVLDTTGSMSGLIDAAKEKIWSIASTMAQASPAPEIRIGLVAYRDRGDSYVTKIVDLSADLDSMYAALMEFTADGGGDTPESVNRALYDAVHAMAWSQDPQSYKVVFLVGDAPPHMDYQDEQRYPEIVAAAARKGIVVNTIQCGDLVETAAPWQQIAALGKGRYFRVAQGGNAVAIATPFDAQIAALAAELDGTRLFYGNSEELRTVQDKLVATERVHELASVEAQARRGVFNASASGAANLAGDRDLVADVASGRVALAAVPRAELPASLAGLDMAERERLVAATAERRADLQRQIAVLAAERDAFMSREIEVTGGAEDSLDLKIYDAVREQAAPKGLRYEGGPKF